MSLNDIIDEEFDAAKLRIKQRLMALLNGEDSSGVVAPVSNPPPITLAAPLTNRVPDNAIEKAVFDDKVFYWINEHPGRYGTDIANAFDCENMKVPLIANSMARLKSHDRVKTKGTSNATVYYANKGGGVGSKKSSKKSKYRTPEENESILKNIQVFVSKHPDSGAADIANAVGINAKDATNRSERMVKEKIFKRRKINGRVLYSKK